MKQVLLIFLLLLFAYPNLLAQKEDYIWTLGYLPNVPDEGFGGTMLNFNTPDDLVSYYNTALSFTPSGVISSPSGILRAYSGGCSIADASHNTMKGGATINQGPIADNFCRFLGYPAGNGVLFLNTFSDSTNYYLLHVRINGKDNPNRLRTDFLQTQIRFNTSFPYGFVTEIDKPILNDTFSDHLTAVRHGNGRDWWVVANKDRGNTIFVFHLTPKGISQVKQQSIGPQWSAESYQGQSVFSPDGRLFARAAPFNNLTVLDFDRCSGIFSNPRWVPMPDNEAFACGVAFSPNSQYLYLTTGLELHQYDVEVQDLASSRILIDTFDGFASPFSTTFFQMRLAPDEKIYMQATNGVNVMHTIHKPNRVGKMCDFRQHDLQLPSFIDVGAPNVPYFRLYDLPDSPCDTLGINAPTVSATASTEETGPSVQIAPNPTSSRSALRFSEPYSGNIIIYDGLGRRVYSVQVENQSAVNLDAGQLPNGLYQIYCDGLRMGMLKWMIYR